MYKKVKKDVQKLLTASGFIAIFDVVRNIVVANILGPYLTGLCTTLMAIPQIGQYFNLGIIDALTIVIPDNRGRNNHTYAEKVKTLVFTVTNIVSLVFFLIIILYTVIVPQQEYETTVYIILAGLLIVLWQAKKFFVTLYASENCFTKLSWVEFSFSLLVTVSQILLVYYFSGYGFWLGFIIPNILILIYCALDYRRSKIGPWFNSALGEVKRIIPLGVTMLISAVTYGPFVIASRIFLAITVGVKEVGFFLVAVVIISKMSILPSTIARVITPKMSFMHAETTRLEASFRLFKKAQFYTFCMVIVIFVVGIFSVEKAVMILMPSFLPGVPAAKIMLLAGIPYCLIDNANNFLLAHQYKRAYMKNLACTLIFQMVVFGCLYFKGNITACNVTASLAFIFLFYGLISNYKVIQLYRKN